MTFDNFTIKAQQAVDNELQHQPRVSGGSPYLDQDANQVVLKAQDIAKKDGDTYVGLEPLLLALLNVKSLASQMLKDAGATEEGLRQAIKELRGGQKATSQSRPLSAPIAPTALRRHRPIISFVPIATPTTCR